MRQVFTSIALGVVLAACGGSSGGGGGSGQQRSFTGVWHLVIVSGLSPSLTTRWGQATADDSGQVTFNFQSNSAGASVGPGSLAGTYTVGGAGGLDVVISSGGPTLSGAVSSDGQYANLSSTTGTPAVYFMIRVGAIPDPSVVEGDYHGIRARETLSPAGISMAWIHTISVDLSGSGMLAGAFFGRNVNGVAGSSTWGFRPMSVDASDGAAHNGGSGTPSGGVQVDGQAMLFGGDHHPSMPIDPFGAVFLRQSTAADDARFSGTYRVAGLQADHVTPEFLSTAGTLAADGAGGGSINATLNREGGGGALTGTFTSSVAADGLLLFEKPASNLNLNGAVSPDGRVVILGGGRFSGQFPSFFVLVRLE